MEGFFRHAVCGVSDRIGAGANRFKDLLISFATGSDDRKVRMGVVELFTGPSDQLSGIATASDVQRVAPASMYASKSVVSFTTV